MARVPRFGMKRYANLSGNSGVLAYQIGPDSIAVKFQDGKVYFYTHASTGPVHIKAMKQLAAGGSGLCTYIARHVREAYASKQEAAHP